MSETENLLGEIKDNVQRRIFKFIINEQKKNNEQLEKINESLFRISDDIISRTQLDVNALSVKVDRLLVSISGGKTVQKKRGGTKETIKRAGGPRQNILGWIKDGWIKDGWKFFDFVIDDAESTINGILDCIAVDPNKKKDGIYKKREEAAFIWHRIKDVPGIQEEMKIRHEDFKEKKKKEHSKLAKPDEDDNSEMSNEE